MPMIFSESAKTKGEMIKLLWLITKCLSLSTPYAPMVPIRTNTFSKAQVTTLNAKRKRYLMTHIYSTHHHRKRRHKSTKVNTKEQAVMKNQDTTTCVEVTVGRIQGGQPTVDVWIIRAHQEAPMDAPVVMDQDNDGDDLLEEEKVDYGTTPEHQGMEVNIITFSVDHDIIKIMKLWWLSLILVQEKWSSPNRRN